LLLLLIIILFIFVIRPDDIFPIDLQDVALNLDIRDSFGIYWFCVVVVVIFVLCVIDPVGLRDAVGGGHGSGIFLSGFFVLFPFPFFLVIPFPIYGKRKKIF
jgi:hypothetical protein